MPSASKQGITPMAISQADKQKLLERMRAKQAAQTGFKDPSEWRPPKMKKDEERKFRVIFLPPLNEGDKCVGGTASSTLDLWYLPHGHHFINKKRYECPRVHIEKGECPLCSTGFDLMREVDDKEVRSKLAKEWLAQSNFAVNVYFENHKDNPEDLRGKVLWWSIPVSVFNKCDKAFKSDSAGDDDNPQAFGLFFDPENAFPFIVNVTEKSGYNNYESSVFTSKSRPIAQSDEEIQDILDRRHDLYKKFEGRDIKALEKLLNDKLAGGSEQPKSNEDGDDGYIAKPETGSSKSEVKTESKVESKAKVEESKPKTESAKTETKPKAEDKPKAETKPKVEEPENPEDDPELKALLAQLADK